MAGVSEKAAKRRRGPGRPFQKGQSGNPAGRSKADMEIRAAARKYTQQALDTLVRNLDCDNPSVANVAAVALLDRGHGKPTQTIEGDITIREMLAERLAAARKRERG